MRITLGSTWTDPEGDVHRGNETIDVDDRTARMLLRDGTARPADPVQVTEPDHSGDTTEGDTDDR